MNAPLTAEESQVVTAAIQAIVEVAGQCDENVPSAISNIAAIAVQVLRRSHVGTNLGALTQRCATEDEEDGA